MITSFTFETFQMVYIACPFYHHHNDYFSPRNEKQNEKYDHNVLLLFRTHTFIMRKRERKKENNKIKMTKKS